MLSLGLCEYQLVITLIYYDDSTFAHSTKHFLVSMQLLKQLLIVLNILPQYNHRIKVYFGRLWGIASFLTEI